MEGGNCDTERRPSKNQKAEEEINVDTSTFGNIQQSNQEEGGLHLHQTRNCADVYLWTYC